MVRSGTRAALPIISAQNWFTELELLVPTE
jgi:hypothetical protein